MLLEDRSQPLSRFRLNALRCLVLAVLGWVAISLTGAGSIFGPWSQAIIGSIVRVTYSGAGQDDATVLLFREDNLRTLGSVYPVPYALHADVLDALGASRPRAVFIDFAFIDERPAEDPDTLARAICRLRNQGVDVKLAVVAPEIENYGVLPGLIRDQCADPVDVSLDEPDADAGLLSYSPGAVTEKNGFVPTPAFALLPQQVGIAPTAAKAMEIVWVPGNAPLNEKWMACGHKGFYASVKEILTLGPRAMRESCPYTRTISVNHLLNAPDDNDVVEALQGRTIFYGADFRMTGDRVPISLFEELPGVFVHAMAYDNLLSLGADYKRADRESPISSIVDFSLLLLAAFLLVRFSPPDIDDFETFARQSVTTIVALVAVITVGLVSVHFWGVSGGLLGGFVAYVVYRCVLDSAFRVLCVLTLLMSLFAYSVLDLGPRNILLFVVFFQAIRSIQQRAHQLVEKYKMLRRESDSYGNHESFVRKAIDRFFRWLMAVFQYGEKA